MAHFVDDRVKETTTTTGTGALALGGAVANFRDFDTLMGNGDTTNYAIIHRTANEWEVGRGTWNTGNTLSRTVVYAGTNGTSAVNLSAGTKDVFMTLNLAGSWPGINLEAGAVVDWAGIDLTTAGGKLRLSGGQLQLNEPGGANNPPLQFPAPGTLMSAPVAGAIELDATNLYATTDDDNRGYIPVRHFIRAITNRNLASSTNPQAIFNDPANGRITLSTGTYKFESLLRISAMSGTSGNAQILWQGAGTATTDTWAWHAYGYDSTTVAGPVAAQAVSVVTANSLGSIWTAAVGTAMIVTAFGMFEVTAAGTLIPTIDLVTAASAVVNTGSYFICERIGAVDVVSVGEWD